MGDSASTFIHRARDAAGLTQSQLARRASVTQSVVSAYERGRRDPSFAMLQRLLEATGHRVELMPSPPRVDLRALVDQNAAELRATFASLGARNPRLFGSVARGDFRPDSDVDLLVDLDESVSLIGLARLQTEAERILGVPVDVVPANSLKPHVAVSVAHDAIEL